MDKKKTIIVWTIYENEGLWRYSFGHKAGTIATSESFLTKESARKSLDAAIQKTKKQLGPACEVVTEELKF